METKRLVAFLLLAAFCQPTNGQMNFWLSTTADVAVGSSPGETPSIEYPRGGIGAVHIWAKPDDGKTLENFSLNLLSTSETAIEFVSAEIINGERFGSVFDTNHGLDLSNQGTCVFPAPLHGIWKLSGFSVDPSTGSGLNSAAPGDDAYYDEVNESWLLATIEYLAAENGTTDLYLEIGDIGMNYEGESATDMSVRFGSLADLPLSNAADDRCMGSATREARIEVIDPMPGDFNLNGLLDADDIDLLSAEVRAETHNAYYDLISNANVDEADRVQWVETLKGTNFGDANLDGIVDFEDFLRLSGGYGLPLGWADGDTDGDFMVSFLDFLKLSGNFRKGAVFEAAESVPEPSGSMLHLISLCVLLAVRRRG